MTTTKSISAKTKDANGRGCLILFFTIFFLAGSGFFIGFVVLPVANMIRATSWVETPCKILASKVKTHDGDDGDTYSVYVCFEYYFAPPTNAEAEKKRYVSERYSFMVGSTSGYSGKEEIVKRYPVGSKRTCYVNSSDPNEAVIDPGFQWGMLFGLIPVVFMVIGGAGLFWAIFRMGNEDKGNSISSKAQGGSRIRFGGKAEKKKIPNRRITSTGEIELKATSSPFKNLIGVTVLGLFWNGIISIFVYESYSGWGMGHPDYVLMIFLIPFVAVGIGLIVGIFYYLLSLFNPRPVVRIGNDHIPLGGTVSLKWSFNGDTSRIRRLKIELIGREEATYTRGTDTVTDKEEFYKHVLVDTTSAANINAGIGEILIPFDTMHSFEASNNKIIWELHFNGDIKLWPDVNESFKLKIYPLAPGDEI
ncbi:MAG: DUF3592 domain-containing protein [Deltaproteobacteria bacterium]|nr:DUF3592 domain-containing protein [Deltaproteobacteria bacterium]